ncbi:MAG: PINc/VapC family ATPase [Candidatus Hodarchaeales archaeon]
MVERYSIGIEKQIFVPDTSVIINEGLYSILKDTIESGSQLVIHAAMIAELEHQANTGNNTGFKGLRELEKIRKLSSEKDITITYEGRRPSLSEVKRARSGEIDAIIRDFAWKVQGVLITSDKVQYLGAKAIGIETIFFQQEKIHISKRLGIEKYFDDKTMSIHLKQGAPVYVKRGKPGSIEFKAISPKVLSKEDLISFSDEIQTKANLFEDTFIEIERKGSTIVQYGDIRIVICKPPFSDGWEITAVRPLVKLSIEDYNLSQNLFNRLEEKAEGILVAGSPGTGKTTFVRALTLFYEKQSKIIKTIESPRDLDLKAEITQYSKNFGTRSEIHDILLLSRPDYTIFDEIRDTEDFKLYTDLRLAGIGLVGVIHSSTAIDAVQRFIGRLELGVIPSVLDTIIYMRDGTVSQVLEVKMTVKVPTGLIESDLARPVIEVKDFETGEIVYEMYTFGEQTVVIPINESDTKKRSIDARTLQNLTQMLEQFTNESIVLIPKDRYGRRYEIQCAQKDIPQILGRRGENIKRVERLFNVKLDVNKDGSSSNYNSLNALSRNMVILRKKSITLAFTKKLKDSDIGFFTKDPGSDELTRFFIGTVSRTGKIKLSPKSDAGNIIKQWLEEDNFPIYWKIL